ncbi:MAG TPA: hypothetical protein VEZ40_04675, partial [Pyrinomonadaceae bacterium]|nr:hypothetical protein [Pyrinomonadaceae bacterium]
MSVSADCVTRKVFRSNAAKLLAGNAFAHIKNDLLRIFQPVVRRIQAEPTPKGLTGCHARVCFVTSTSISVSL